MPQPRQAPRGAKRPGGAAPLGSTPGDAAPPGPTPGAAAPLGSPPHTSARPEPPLADAAAGAVFAALADPTRRHLLATLAERGGGTATGLAAELPITRQAVAKHLATLGRAGLVSQRRDGRESRFELDPRPLTDAATWLTTVGAEWDGRLADLRRLLGRVD